MIKKLLIASALVTVSGLAMAEDFDPKHHLESECHKCHTDDYYTRPDRRAKSLPQLGRIVRRCETNLGTGLFDDEVEVLTHYLNDTYYKFK